MTTLEPREATDQLPYVSDEQDWDETEDDLPVRPVRKRLGPLSLGLIGAVVAAGAFYGGVMTEKNHVTATTVSAGARARTAGTTATTTAGGRTSTTGAGGAAAAGGAGGAGAGAGATFGTVKLIDGTNVYVADASGNITKVATNAQSAITITSTGTAKNIKPGDTVVVTGPTGADGTITATAIRDAGAGGGGLGGFGGRTRGAGAGGAGAAGPAGGAVGPPPAGAAFGGPPGG